MSFDTQPVGWLDMTLLLNLYQFLKLKIISTIVMRLLLINIADIKSYVPVRLRCIVAQDVTHQVLLLIRTTVHGSSGRNELAPQPNTKNEVFAECRWCIH